MISDKKKLEIEDIEIKLLLEAIKEICGHDYSDYSMAHIKRRLRRRLGLSKILNISRMTEHILYDDDFLNTILNDLSINVSEMFRFPAFYKEIREKVVPILKTYPSYANFFLCKTDKDVCPKLLNKNIYIKNCANKTTLNDKFLRIAIRKQAENKILTDALREIV